MYRGYETLSMFRHTRNGLNSAGDLSTATTEGELPEFGFSPALWVYKTLQSNVYAIEF
jgi:hypothetical protein